MLKEDSNNTNKLYHGSGDNFTKFNQEINWLTSDYDYAKYYALSLRDEGFIYTCETSLNNLFDIGETGFRVYDLIPLNTPFKVSKKFLDRIESLNLSSEEIDNLLKEVIKEWALPFNGYKMMCSTIARSNAFKKVLMGKGYKGIHAREYNVPKSRYCDTYGIFDGASIKIDKIDKIKLNESIVEGIYQATNFKFSEQDVKRVLEKELRDGKVSKDFSYGPSLLLSDGSVYNVASYGGFHEHGAGYVAFKLKDNGGIDFEDEDFDMEALDYMEAIGIITLNSGDYEYEDRAKIVIEFKKPSDAQYRTILEFIDTMQVIRGKNTLLHVFARGQHQTYLLSAYTSDEIVKKIKRCFAFGRLEEYFDEIEDQGADTLGNRLNIDYPIYVTDEPRRIKAMIEKGDEPYRIYSDGTTYLIQNARGNKTHRDMCEKAIRKGYITWDVFTGNDEDYIVFIPKNFLGGGMRYLTSLGSDDYYSCYVYDFGVLYARDSLAYEKSLFKLLGEPEREIYYDGGKKVTVKKDGIERDFDLSEYDWDPNIFIDLKLESTNEALGNGGDTFIYKGKKYWCGAVDTLDGTIEEVHSYKQAQSVGFHHSFLFSEAQLDKMEDGLSCVFFVWNDHSIQVDAMCRFNPEDVGIKLDEEFLKNRIREQIKFIDNESLKESKQDIEKFKQWAGDGLANRFFKVKNRLKSPFNDFYYWLSLEKKLGPDKELAHQNALDSLDYAISDVEVTPTKKERQELAKNGSEKIYNDDRWLVLKINTFEASVKYGKHTQWCITGTNSGMDGGRSDWRYHSGSTFYFFIDKKNNTKYALEYYDDNDWCLWDEQDYPMIGKGSNFNNALDVQGEAWNPIDQNKVPNFPKVNGLPNLVQEFKDVAKDEYHYDKQLVVEEKENNIIDFAMKNIGTSDKPVDGPSYILPNGKYLTIWKSKIPVSKYSSSGSATHRDVQQFLYDKGLVKDDFWNCEDPDLERLGCIRVNSGFEEYIWLPDNRPNETQWNSLLVWLDWYFRFHSKLMVGFKHYAPKTYYSKDYTTDEILKKCKEAYGRGYLTETIVNDIDIEKIIHEEGLATNYDNHESTYIMRDGYSVNLEPIGGFHKDLVEWLSEYYDLDISKYDKDAMSSSFINEFGWIRINKYNNNWFIQVPEEAESLTDAQYKSLERYMDNVHKFRVYAEPYEVTYDNTDLAIKRIKAYYNSGYLTEDLLNTLKSNLKDCKYDLRTKGWHDKYGKIIRIMDDDWEPDILDWYYSNDTHIFENDGARLECWIDEKDKVFTISVLWKKNDSKGEATKLFRKVLELVPKDWKIQINNNVNQGYWKHVFDKYFPDRKYEDTYEALKGDLIKEQEEYFKHINEEVEIKGDEFSFTLEDICKKYPDLVSNSYQSCGPAFIMPNGKYLLSGKRFDMHGDLAFQCLMDIEGLSEQEIENEFDTSNLTNFFTRFFKLVRVNDGSKLDVEDRAYFVVPYNSITSSQMNALQEFVDYILKNKYSKKIYDIQAFVGTHYAHQKWDLQFNNPTSDEIIDDVKFAMTRGFFGESLEEKIVKKGNKWQVQSEKGRNLGTYDTKEEAEKRLQQVHYFKHVNEYLDRLDSYSGTDIYATDSPYQLKNLLEKGDKPYRIYYWKGAYYFCSALGDMTHNGMMQFLFDKGYTDGDGFDEWGLNNYMVFVPKNFDTNLLVYDTSLGSDEYYYCRVYDIGVMFVRDYSTYSNSLFNALGTPEREVFLNEEDGVIEIEKDDKHYEIDWNNLRNLDDALTIKLESLKEALASKEQEEYFKNSKIRDEKGNLLVCYHGTETPGFNEFDARKGKSQFGDYKFDKYNVNYFTTNKETAAGYTEFGYEDEKKGNVYACYLNIENPYVVNNKTKDDMYRTWQNIKDETIRNKEIDYFKRFYNKWSSRNISEKDLNELNKDLFYFNCKFVVSDEDSDYYDLISLNDNTMYGSAHPLMYYYELEEYFDKDNYEEFRNSLVGDYEGEDKEYFRYTIDNLIRWVLLMNEEEGTNYDGIIVPEIYDIGPKGSPFLTGKTTDIVTLKSSNQIKKIDNLKPTSSNNINEEVKDNILDALDKEFGQEEVYMWSTYILPNGHFLNPDNSSYFENEEPQYEHCDFEDWAWYNGYKDELQTIYDNCIKMNVTVPYISMPDKARPTNGQLQAVKKIIDNKDSLDALDSSYIRSILPPEQAEKVFRNAVGKLVLFYTPMGHKVFDLGIYNGDDIVRELNKAYTRGQFLSENLKEGLQEIDNCGHKLTQEQIAFFKDSKVRNEKGELIVCYHSTNADFDTFKDSSEILHGNQWGDGFYFSTHSDNIYAYGSKYKSCYLNITKPFIYGKHNQDENLSKELIKNYCGDFDEKFYNKVNKFDPLGTESNVLRYIQLKTGKSTTFTKVLKASNFDGVIADNLGDIESRYAEVVAFYSNQIKAITNKTPTTSNNINEDYKDDLYLSEKDFEDFSVGPRSYPSYDEYDDDNMFYGIMLNDENVGNLAFRYDYEKDSLYLDGIEIKSQYRNKGIGRRAIELLKNEFPRAKEIKLNAVPDAIDFYKKLGFKVTSGTHMKLKLNESYKDDFISRTNQHIARVNKYAKKINKSYPNHDSDKFNELFDGYSLMNKKDASEEEQNKIDDATYKHVINNEHHCEHWCNPKDVEGFSRSNPTPHGCLDCTKMPEDAMIEMCCDWCAMSEEFNNTSFEWFDKVKDTRWHFNEKQEKFILDTLHKLWDDKDELKESQDTFDSIVKEELDTLNKWLDKYGFEVKLVNDYNFTTKDVGMFLGDIQDNASVFPIALNKNQILKLAKKYDILLDDAIEGTLWHEAGHGIYRFLQDVYELDDNEEDVVEEFARYKESSYLFEVLKDYMCMNESLRESTGFPITVYTYQKPQVRELLEKGKTYIADYSRGMFHDYSNENESQDPYRHLSRVLGFNNCPIFGALSKDELHDMLDSSGIDYEDENILHLEIPSNNIKCTEYYDWTDYIYALKEPEEFKEESGLSIEDLENMLRTQKSDYDVCQVVFDRIEPEWLSKED